MAVVLDILNEETDTKGIYRTHAQTPEYFVPPCPSFFTFLSIGRRRGKQFGCKVVAEISDFVLKEPAVFGRLSSSFLYDIENLGMLSNYVFGRLSSSCKFNFFLPTQRINSFDACYERVNPISREATSLESNSIAGRVLFGLVSGFLFSSCLSPTFLV